MQTYFKFKKFFYILLTIIIIAACYLIYEFRLLITINSLKLYGNITNNPNIERWVGECYFSLSYESEQTAQKYFKISLDKYLYKYNHNYHKLTKDKEYHLMEYIIGNSYEYGKGTEKNLPIAKQWYEKAANGGIHDAKIALDRVDKNINDQSDHEKQ